MATSEPLPHEGPLKHGSVGRPTGVDLRVVDQNGRTCPAGAQGEVWVHGPTVARGYLADPAGTAHSFPDGWFRTGDLGSLDEDGYLFLTGRINSLINRGGETISPEHVEDVLAGCPGVTEAAVFAIPDASVGQRVGAAVVVCEGEGIGAERILQYCRHRLSAARGTRPARGRRCPTSYRRGRARPARGGGPVRTLRPRAPVSLTRCSFGSGWSNNSASDKPVAAFTNARAATEPGVAA